jgi:hypothetical protein
LNNHNINFDKTLKLSFHYVTNFQPNSNIETITKVNNKGVVKNNKIFCKNFIIFIILIRRLFKKKTPTVFIKPTYKNTYNILRAPYKNKISKHQICLSRFFIVVSFKLKFSNKLNLSNLASVFFLVKFLKKFYSFFETNISYQHKSILSFYFYLSDYFLLEKYS